MATNLSMNPHDEQGGNTPEVRGIDEESCDDESVDSRSSSESESSSEDSSAESPPPAISMNGDQIRQNARELLQASPAGAGLDHPGKKNGTTASATKISTDKPNHGYQSYHDANAPTVRMSSTSQFSNSDHATTATPPWASHNESDEGLSVTDVASLAFACVTHCVTEGYRAASTYYGGYENTQYPSVSGANDSHNNYQQVGGGYHNEAHGNFASPNDNGSSNDGYKNNGYGDSSYQTKFSENPSGHGEVMDRDLPQHSSQSSGQDTEQTTQHNMIEEKEEWASVQVPSTYQGGRLSM